MIIIHWPNLSWSERRDARPHQPGEHRTLGGIGVILNQRNQHIGERPEKPPDDCAKTATAAPTIVKGVRTPRAKMFDLRNNCLRLDTWSSLMSCWTNHFFNLKHFAEG